MGVIQPEETHESQSSSMSYALRWKHENLRHLMLAAIGAIAITVLVLLIVHNQAGKKIHLVVDGRVTTVETREAMLHEVLDEQAISLKPQDEVSMPLNGVLQDGDRIFIKLAVPVKVTADGKVNTIFTTQDTVGNVLKETGISIKGEDTVKPSLETKIIEKADIRVVRVTKQTVKQTENRSFRVIKTADPSLVKGDNRVIQSGKPGIVVNHIEKVYEDGKLVSKNVIGKEIQRKTKDKIIAVGTKKVVVPEEPVAETESADITTTANATVRTAAKESSPEKPAVKAASAKVKVNNVVSRAGVDFEYKKVLNNVSMTAYSAEQKGIGTRTASGTRVTEGRTIAVDPSVVPIGWWVYIEGVGFRRAEDTGGAIKGNKIDVYFDSLKAAYNFGRKSGHTVYVIGPVKPELN
ncbi:G5 domain-containing protein [Paenibacillus sp. N3/727]|uniref:3D domain-containing protein n=1 Tax=Paenibacillus sp. N3/727 TaxID=2925845 RepID=UPI001F53856B|nr:3D domain-containing protein [Paenibacillus sp. N3/727]UNK18515.1 G5 domain-containing protein [Paenibacillus sp. N3/727]